MISKATIYLLTAPEPAPFASVPGLLRHRVDILLAKKQWLGASDG
jgi:hypothetical protein